MVLHHTPEWPEEVSNAVFKVKVNVRVHILCMSYKTILRVCVRARALTLWKATFSYQSGLNLTHSPIYALVR